MSTAAVEDTPLRLARLAGEHMGERGIENARLEAELLLAHVLGLSRLELYLQHDRPLTEQEKGAYRDVIRRRLRREPLQYITGKTQFRELELHVDRRALIPRPETEILVGAVLDWARERASHGPAVMSAVDIGTGTGAIALSLAVEGDFDRVVATDISADALALARDNAERLELEDRVEFRHGSLWSALEPGEAFDVIVSNPPYIAESERDTLQAEVVEWEPSTALFARDDGLEIVNRLIEGAADRLRPDGLLALEVGAGQTEAAVVRIGATAGLRDARVLPDLSGRDRVVLARRETLA